MKTSGVGWGEAEGRVFGWGLMGVGSLPHTARELGGPAGTPIPIGLHFIQLGSFALELSFNLRSRMAEGAKSFKAMPPLFDWCLVCLVWGPVGKERIAKLRRILSLLLRTEAE